MDREYIRSGNNHEPSITEASSAEDGDYTWSPPRLPPSIEHHAILCRSSLSEWLQVLVGLLTYYDPTRALVFTNSRHDAGNVLIGNEYCKQR